MSTWWQAVADLRAAREAGVLVTVTDVRGHAPREAGAKMVVSATTTTGSVGGGNLEAEAVRRARVLLETGQTKPQSFESHLSDKAPLQHGVQCCGGEVSVLLEPLPVVPSVAIFGVGHVGLELARILARHDLDLHLVDSRAEHLSDETLRPLEDAVAAVHVHPVPVLPELVLTELPPGTHLLVMTHDHAEDVALCDAAIRLEHLGPIGLIGSSAKLARFRSQLLADGHDPTVVDRIRTPIGLRGVTTSKEPAAIAVAVAAELLAAFEREGAPRAVTLYRGTFLDTPQSPFKGNHLRAEADAALLVSDGVIAARGPADQLLREHPDEEVVDLREGLVLPGFVDTHVHFPQVRAIGGLGMPLLDWLERCALPEEARLADTAYAAGVAADFVDGLARAGTTTALVFGSHFATAVDALFEEATRVGLRVTSGLVLSDRILREDLFTTPDRAYAEGLELAKRWHGSVNPAGRTRYAVTPRFSLSCTDALLESAGALLGDVPDAWFTSHINENREEIAGVRELFGCDYTTSYDKHGLLGPRSVLAHNVHPTRAELRLLGQRGVAVAHCPTSNAALGSGLFPLGAHLTFRVRVALGSDVGAGTGFSLFKEGLQAYFAQQLLGLEGHRLTAGHLLHLATAAGAEALGLSEVTGDLSVGKEYDALWLRPEPGTTLDVALRHADSPDDALAKAFALAGPADVRQTWVAGTPIRQRSSGSSERGGL